MQSQLIFHCSEAKVSNQDNQGESIFRTLLLVLITLISSVSAFEITGKWEVDSKVHQEYLRKIGAVQKAQGFKIEINLHAVETGGESYPLCKFETMGNKTHIFFMENEPVFITQQGDKHIRVMNILGKIFICKKNSDIEKKDETFPGLKGRWYVKTESLLKAIPPNERAMLINFDLEQFKKLDFVELEFFKNSVVLYVCDFPIILNFIFKKFEVHRNSEKEYKIIAVQGLRTYSVNIVKEDEDNIKISIPGKPFSLEMAKSTEGTVPVKFTRKYINSELRKVLKAVNAYKSDDDYKQVSKIEIKMYIHSLLKDKKKILETFTKEGKNIPDEDIDFFYEGTLGYLYYIAEFKEMETFFQKHIKGKLTETGSLLLLVEKALDENKKEKLEEYLAGIEKALTEVLKNAKDAPEEEYEYLYQDYLNQRSIFLYLQNRTGKKIDFSKEHPLTKVFYQSYTALCYRLEGKFEQKEIEIDKTLKFIPRLSADYFKEAFVQFTWSLPTSRKKRDFILPYKKIQYIDKTDFIDSWDKNSIYLYLAAYHYNTKELDHCYLNLFKAFKGNAIAEHSTFAWILARVNNAAPFYLAAAFLTSVKAENDLYIYQDYLDLLASKLSELDKKEK